jgi:hypothetical protein
MSFNFNASVLVSEQLNRLMVNAAQELAQRAVNACAEHYNFDAEEAIRLLGLRNVKLERKTASKEKAVKKTKVEVPKLKFPLPYNGEFNAACCYALRQNNGLYTQCTGDRKGDAQFCKSCAKSMQKLGADIPEYGTIQQRQAVGIFEYVDPKGRKPVAYTKVMKKFKVSEEEVREEAGKLNITIDANHFIIPEETKKGRKAKTEKEVKAKGTKGRPKKEKKVIQIEDDEEDLFAALVSEANAEETSSPKKKDVSDEEKAAKAAKKEQERIEREAKKKAEEEAKAAKKEQERLEREAKKKAEEEEKAAKAAKKEQERLQREAKKSKSSKKEENNEEVQEEEEEQPDVVKKIEFEGKKYLKSKNTGIIYDYLKYVKESEQIQVGKWNTQTNKIDFFDDEESEEEYD